MKAEVLRMNDVYIGSSGTNPVRGIWLLAGQGEIINLIGITGSGKSMLRRYFMGEEVLERGTVIYNGKTMKPGERFAASNDVVCVSSAETLLPGLSIAENLRVITRRRKIRGIIHRKSLNNQVNFLLQQYAPELRADMKAENLTMVQRHIVELLRAVENEARMIYIDNAFEMYGQADMQRMAQVFEQLKERRITIIYANRRVDDLSQMAERMIVLRKGENVKTFYKQDFSRAKLRDWIAGTVIVDEFQKRSARTEVEVLCCSGITGMESGEQTPVRIHRGEVVGIYDLNYRANLEFVHMLIGEKPLTKGAMYLDGQRYHPASMEEAVRRRVGYISHMQYGSKLTDNMTFAENLALPVLLKMSTLGLLKNRRLDVFLEREYHQRLGIAESDIRLPARSFDPYVRMNIMLHKWLLAKPLLLVCEDICEETDMKMSNMVYGMIGKIAAGGTAVVIASQNLRELEHICDTIYVMNSQVEYF